MENPIRVEILGLDENEVCDFDITLCALLGSFFQPLATGDEGDGSGLVKLLLRLEYLVGKVLFVPSFI